MDGIAPLDGVSLDLIKELSKENRSSISTIQGCTSCQKILIAVSVFNNQDIISSPIATIVSADLELSGQFKRTTTDVVYDVNSIPEFDDFKRRNIDLLLTGRVGPMSDGRIDVRYRLWDVKNGQDLGGQSFSVDALDLRLVSHKIADYIFEKFTNDKGMFSSRIAFISKQKNRYQLNIAEYDGQNAQPALTSPEPIISPRWAPNGNDIAYVSFESRKPVIYIHDVTLGKRRILANFKGSNSAPAWSPDGKTLAIALSRDSDSSQIYVIDSMGGEIKRVSQSSAIDTEPVFSSDGKELYFVSDRSGLAHIYKTSIDGGAVNRVTPNDVSAFSPAISPDGKWLAFIARRAGRFTLQIMELQTRKITALTNTSFDAKPSFSPNSQHVLYSTNIQGKQIIAITSLDGTNSVKLLPETSSAFEPHWGPAHKLENVK